MPQQGTETFGQIADAGLRAYSEFLTTEDPERKRASGEATAQWAQYLQANEFHPKFARWSQRFLRELDYSRLQESGDLERRQGELQVRLNEIEGQLGALSRRAYSPGEGYAQARQKASLGPVVAGELQEEQRTLQEQLAGLARAGEGLEGLKRRASWLTLLQPRDPAKSWQEITEGRPVDGAVIEGGFWTRAPDDKYALPDHVFNAAAFGREPEAQRRRELYENPMQLDEDGSRWVVAKGVPHAIPDLSRYRDEIREAFTGVHPRSGNLVHEGLITGQIPKVLGKEGRDYDVAIDLPGELSELPWLPRLSESPNWREETAKNLQKPEYRRALLEELVALDHAGELDKTFMEKVAFMGIAMGEFIAVNKAVAATAGRALTRLGKSKTLQAKLPAVAGAARLGGAAARATGYTPSTAASPYWTGVRFGARNISEEVIYELVRSAIVNDLSPGEAIASGVAEGAAELVLGKGAGLMRSLLGKVSRSRLGKPLHFLTMPLHRRIDALRALEARGGPQYLESLVSSLPSGRVDLQKIARSMFKDAKVAETALRSWDAYWVGSLFGGYTAAVRQEGFDELPAEQQLLAVFSHVLSEDALANATVFVSTTLAYGGMDFRTLSKKLTDEQQQLVARTITSLVNDAAHPVDPGAKEFEGLIQWFGELRAENPEFFKDEGYQPVETFEEPEPIAERSEPKPRSAARVEEMAGFFEQGRLEKGRFIPSLTKGANLWLQRGGKYRIRRRKTTAEGEYQFIIEHAQGKLEGKQVGNTQVWGTLEDAMAQANGVAKFNKQYRTDREDVDELEFEDVTDEAVEAGEKVIEEIETAAKKKPPEKKRIQATELQQAKRRARDRLDAMSPGEIATRARRTARQRAFRGLSAQEAVFKQLVKEESAEYWRRRQKAAYKKWRGKNPPDIITRIRESGGINMEADDPAIQDLIDRYGDTGRYRRSPRQEGKQIGLETTLPGFLRSGSGSESLDYLREALVEEGYLPEGSDVNDLLEAIHQTADGERVFATSDAGYETLAETLELDEAELRRQQDVEGFEEGYVDVPETEAERLQLATHLYPEETRGKGAADILALLEERTPSKSLRLTRMFEVLGNQADQVFERLQELGVLGPDVPPRSIEAQRAMNDLARGRVEGATEQDVQAAWHYQAAARTVVKAALRDMGDAQLGEAAELYFEALDSTTRTTTELDPLLRGRLKKHGMLGADGFVKPDVPHKLAQLLAHKLAQLAKQAGAEPAEATFLYALDPISLVLGGGIDSEWGRHAFQLPGSENWRAQTLYTKLSGKLPIRINRMLVDADRAIGRMWKGSTIDQAVAKTIEDAIREVVRPAQTRHANLMAAMHHVLHNWTRFWGGHMPTMGDRKRLIDMVDSGAFRHMKGPEDVELRYGKGTGYLFDIAQQYVSVANEMGVNLRDLGAITEQQFAAWKSRWVPRRMFKTIERDNYEKMRRGDASFFIPRYDIMRKAGKPMGWAERVWDPYIIFPSAAAGEGKIAEILEILNGFIDEGFAVPFDEARKWMTFTKDHYRVAAWGEGGKRGVDPLAFTKVNGQSLRLHAFLSNLRNSLAPEGVQPKGSQRPRTKKMVELLDAYLGKTEPGVVLPAKLVDEIDLALSDFFDAPTSAQNIGEAYAMGALTEYAGKRFDQISRWWRRAVTIQNPTHWTLNIGSSVMTNHLWGGVTIGDFVKSVFTGKGHYADAWRSILKAEEWWELGKPGRNQTEMPDELVERGWTLDEWASVKQLEEASEILTGGTFRKTAFDVSIAGEMFQPMLQAQERGRGQNVVMDSLDAIVAYQENMAASSARIDSMLMRAFGGVDMGNKIQAVADLYQAYAMTELGFKYAATLGAIRSGRFKDVRTAATWAAQGTADYGNTSPLLRRWSTRFSIAASPLVRATERHALLKQTARIFLGRPFLLWQQNMIPMMAWGIVARPHAALGIYALANIMQGALWHLFTETPDEEVAMMEALAGTPGFEGLEFSREEGEALYRALESGPIPNFLGGASFLAPEIARQVQLSLLRHWLTAAGPRKGARTQTTDLSDLAPGIGVLGRMYHDARAIPNRTMTENARAINRNFMGYMAHVAASPLVMAGEFVEGLKSRTWQTQVARSVETLTSVMPAMNPGTMFMSRHARRWSEAAAGKSFQDWAAGMSSVYEQRAGERMTEALFGTLWRLRRASNYNQVLDDNTLGRAVLSQFMPFTLGPANEDVARQERAAKMFARAYVSMQRDAYAQWTRNEEGAPGFDQFRDPIFNLTHDVEMQLNADGRHELLDVPEHSTAIGKWIARQPDEMESDLIELWVGVTSSDRWANGPGLVIENAARAKAMDPLMYERLLLAAMSDPEDRGLIRYMDSKIRSDDVIDPGLFYAVFQTLDKPQETAAREAYSRVSKYFREYPNVLPLRPNPLADTPNMMQLLGSDAPEVAPVKKSYELMTRKAQ